MTYRTALFLAAGLAAFMSAGPVVAGSGSAAFGTLLQPLQFTQPADVPTRSQTRVYKVCTPVQDTAEPGTLVCKKVSKQDAAKLQVQTKE